MYILNFVPIFASNYNLNDMLRIQEICKEKGITMQDLSKRMGVTYQALYANASGNPTIGKLQEIASALNVSFTDLFEKSSDEVIGSIRIGNDTHVINSKEDIKKLAENL